MTDPTTLSAAALEEKRQTLEASVDRIGKMALDWKARAEAAEQDLRLLARLLPAPPWFEAEGGTDWERWATWLAEQARRTEAAERENALLTRSLALLCAQGGAVSGHVHTVTPSLETDTVQLLLTDGRVVTLRPVPHPPEETPQP